MKQITLTRGAVAIDLTGVTAVAYHFKKRPGTASAITGACTVVGAPTLGQVQFPIPAAGRYDAEFQITYSGGQIETVPGGFLDVLIVRAEVA